MSKDKIKIELTRNQANLIAWALDAGKDQYEKHLMHDGWDDTTPPIIRSTLQTHKRFNRAISTFLKKVNEPGRSVCKGLTD